MPPPPPLRILAFGASLIRGHTASGTLATPSARWTREVLQKHWPGRDIEVVVEGVSGSRVTDFDGELGFGRRIQSVYSTNPPVNIDSTRSPLFDWVIILGGTNDLAWGRSAEKIHSALTAVSDIPLAQKGTKVLMCTVPECEARFETVDRRRDELNALIKGDKRENVYYFDLHAAIPYHSLDEAKIEEIWDDGLHFTSKGYGLMGTLIGERLIEIIEGDKGEKH